MDDLDMLFNTASVLGSEAEDIDWLEISHDFRTITIPDNKKLAGVTSDEKVNKIYFKCPRYYGDVDLSGFRFRINYTNAQNEGDQYLVMDKDFTNDEITFTWLVGRHACEYPGTLKFVVCAVEADSESVIQREYNTAIHTLQVVQGLETSEDVEEAVVDVIEQFQGDFDKIEHLDEYMTEIRADMQQIAHAYQDALNSEAYAVGTRGENPVEDTDPAYQNNSKYYAEQAGVVKQLMLTSMLCVEDTTSTEITLNPESDTRYIYGELTSLTISSFPSNGIVDISFDSGETPTVLTLPANTVLPGWFDPNDISENTSYEFSIANNKVVISEWPITT